ISAVSIPGIVIASFFYLNRNQLANVKKLRTTLQSREVFLGTAQQVFQAHDTSVYHDSSKPAPEIKDEEAKRDQMLYGTGIIPEVPRPTIRLPIEKTPEMKQAESPPAEIPDVPVADLVSETKTPTQEKKKVDEEEQGKTSDQGPNQSG
ncbi:MAG TPA: hypothetical protein VJ044_19220, partial [Candidatus Hodarchaeales archaeon]|nr:hypothetical protein [Candidatus Hodarchaeales archaeon]